jgi:hypothetical protein
MVACDAALQIAARRAPNARNATEGSATMAVRTITAAGRAEREGRDEHY